MDRALHTIYYDPEHPSGLGGVARLAEAVKKEKRLDVKVAAIKDWLFKQDVYTLHAPAAINFKRNTVFVNGIDKQFQMDLVEMGEYAHENSGVRYLLTCIDVFSKYAWVRPLYDKTAASVTAAFKDVLDQGRKPVKVQTDRGTEFYNRTFQNLLTQYNIKHFSTGNDTKASIIERFNRTLKTKMWRYLTAVNSRKYLPVLQQLVNAYNNATHRSIKMPPNKVNKENEKIVFNNLYKGKPHTPCKFKYNVGDTVRISKQRGVFRKGYEQTYTDEFFKIVECIPRSPPVYKLQDIVGEDINGTFYSQELQKVIIDKAKVFKIEKILKTKKQKGMTMCLVSWRGWPDKYDSWVPKNEIVDISL